MSIESKISAEEVNIKDLSLETPEKETGFNIEKYFDQQAWDKMAAEVKDLQAKSHENPDFHNGSLFGLVANMRTLNPQLDLGLTDWDWLVAERRLSGFKSKSDWQRYLNLAVDMKTLDPRRDVRFTNSDKEKLVRSFNTLSRMDGWNYIASYTALMNSLTPTNKIKLSEDMWKGLLAYFDELPSGGRHNKDARWHDLARVGAELKQINPACHLKITENDWKHMEHWLQERVRLNDWTNFASTGLNMKILAAEKVTTDESGLHILDKKQESKPRETPEVKKF